MDTARELLKGNTPTLVLAVLKDGALHGYGIAREIERRSRNALKFKEGTLYPALHALEREGLITGEWQKECGGRERKVYTITPAGLAALDRRARTWAEFATAIHQVLQGEAQHGTTGTPQRRRTGTPLRPGPEPEPAG
jgi:PadR family transcriptional regulator, regulatory protein PadR